MFHNSRFVTTTCWCSRTTAFTASIRMLGYRL